MTARLSLACVAYLWSNRLLPVEIGQRGAWEVRLLLAYVGMSALCMGLERPFRQVFKRMPSALSCRCLRAFGWLLLIASLAFSVRMWGVAAGIVGWVGVMSVAGVALIMRLLYAPRVALALPGFAGLACALIGVLP